MLSDEMMDKFNRGMAQHPAEWFVDETDRPMYGEIIEDAEGVLYVVTGPDHVWAFAQKNIVPMHDPLVTKPLARAFDVQGNFLLGRRLRYPNGCAIKDKTSTENKPVDN